MALNPRARVLLTAAAVFAALAALIWYLSYGYWSQPVTPLAPPRQDAERLPPQPPATAAPPAATATPSATPAASPAASPAPAPGATPQAQAPAGGDAASAFASVGLLIPVEGIGPEQLQDTFKDSRSAGRVHDSIDIVAPRGARVVAATDGRVVKLFRSVKGGITLYQLASADERLVLYYAHLERYADGLKEGHIARRGETLGYVGDSGNATPGNTHLHFQLYRVADPARFWSGENVNPYPLLRGPR